MGPPPPSTLGRRRPEDEPDPGGCCREDPPSPPAWLPPSHAGHRAESRAGSALVWALATCTVTAYSFNSQVFVWIGSADYGGKLFELFIFHVLSLVFLLYFAAKGKDHFCRVFAER